MTDINFLALQNLRIGQGWDVHALVPDRQLILGGTQINFHLGLLGHSDADVLLHAIIDALLGAAGLGDIGTHFPDTSSIFKDADSCELLKQALKVVNQKGYKIINVDSTIIAQQPKLAPYIPAMRARIAQILGISIEQANVKAKTAEKMGTIGKGLSMQAQAVVLLCKIR